jgi:hypothetical protein
VSSTFNVADLSPFFGGDDAASRTTPFQVGEDDEGISTILPHSPIINQDTKDISQDIRIDMPTGPITRAQARQLQQQVNLILNEYNNLFSENFILPKSSILFILRYIDDRVLREDCITSNNSSYRGDTRAHIQKKQREGGVAAEPYACQTDPSTSTTIPCMDFREDLRQVLANVRIS